MNIQKQHNMAFRRGIFVGAISVLLGLAAMTLIGRADVMIGMGQGRFSWCGPNGCWRQPPLPYSDNRQPTAYMIGWRFDLDRTMALDVLYHHFDPVRVSGTYVGDVDYNPQTRAINPKAKTWALNGNASMTTKTDGISVSFVPHTTLHGVDLSARAGLFLYRQATAFTYPPQEYSSITEAKDDYTEMVGVGIGHTFKNVALSFETFAFRQVKGPESPVGDGPAYGRPFGLVSYMLTARFKL